MLQRPERCGERSDGLQGDEFQLAQDTEMVQEDLSDPATARPVLPRMEPLMVFLKKLSSASATSPSSPQPVLGHGIESALGEGMATRQPPDRQPRTPRHSEPPQRDICILRAGWQIDAPARPERMDQGRERALIDREGETKGDGIGLKRLSHLRRAYGWPSSESSGRRSRPRVRAPRTPGR